MKKLIVNADDFGLHPLINAGIIKGYREGFITSTSLMPSAPCWQEAVQLARRWGENPESAAVAGILHDITKILSYDEQLILCEKYGIILDNAEKENPKLLHAITGAAKARDLFGVSEEIYEAIRWHTTGKPDMTTLEKIIYLADYIEPTRDFEGMDRLRALAYEDLSEAEEYPEPRIVILYGDPLDEVEEMLAKRNLIMKYV